MPVIVSYVLIPASISANRNNQMLRRDFNCWVQRLCWQSLVLLLCIAVPLNAIANESLPPLLKQSKVLACAQSETRAKEALSALWQIEDTEREFPDENMQAVGESTLHAATLDIVLKSLLGTAKRFPSLRNQVERTLLKWNYCDVFQNGNFYDLKRAGSAFIRSKAAEASPENWQGFKALGFLGETKDRFIPNILDLDQQSLRSDYEWLFHRVFREQCFPHPDTSELFDSAEFGLKSNIVAPVESNINDYPHAWDAECIYPQKVPRLTTKVRLQVISLAVPALMSVVKLLPVPWRVPGLITQVKLTDQKVAVPTLLTQVKLQQLPVIVPTLLTQVKLQQSPLTVPSLKTQLVLDVTALKVPKLVTRISLDKIKVVKKAQIKYANNQGNYPGNKLVNQGGNYNGGGSYKQNNYSYKATNRTQKITGQDVTAKIISKPNVALDKKASLLERVLGGLSSGGNVLIVDKIQLTVNEYNGTVETAISSSDIGTSVTAMENKPAMVRELLQALPATRKQQIVSISNTIEKPARLVTTAPKEIKKVSSKPSHYLVVPELQSMLLVTQIETSSRPTPVQIKSKSKRVRKSKAKKRYVSKRNKRFAYKPYPDGKTKAKKKSVEQLLQEYQEYEEKRQRQYLPKKKQVSNSHQRLLDVPEINPEVYWMYWPEVYSEPVALTRDVPPLNTELWVYKIQQSEIKVPRLKSAVRINQSPQSKVKVPSFKSRVRVYKKYTTKPVRVPSLGTLIIQQSVQNRSSVPPSSKVQKNKAGHSVKLQKKPSTVKISEAKFSFSDDRLPDEVFEKTLISEAPASPVISPPFLSSDAPLPYVIVEDFGDDLPGIISATKKAKDKQAKAKKSKTSKPKKKTIGLAGNIYLKQSLKNSNKAVGGSINRKLIKDKHWFARVGWNYTLEESDDPFSYSWGIGYSDWHPGTFSAQLNNWGPIKPEEGLALEKAVANFGYSVKSEFLKKNKLSLSGGINIPVEGNSSISGNFRWSPVKNWYVNTSISHPLEGDGTPKWTYGFGYSDWRPNKINLQYSNYGPNEIPYHNYKDNGTWSLSYNWKF